MKRADLVRGYLVRIVWRELPDQERDRKRDAIGRILARAALRRAREEADLENRPSR
jgi:hypothetical protein